MKKAEPTPAQARAQILAKVAKAAAKGATSLCPASAPPARRTLFEEAAALLEREEALFIDRRKAKPRYFAWSDRPALPSVASVAVHLEQIATDDFPAVVTRARWKAALKSHQDELPLLESALAHLLATHRLGRLGYRKASTEEDLYFPLAAVARLTAAPAAAFAEAPVREAYAGLVTRTGFPAVPIAALQAESAAPLPELQRWLLEEQAAGRVILSRGDWSLADATKRLAAVEWQGEKYLSVRLLPAS